LRLVVPQRPMPWRDVGLVGRPTTSRIPTLVPVIVGLLLLAAGCARLDPEDPRPVVQGSVTATVETDPDLSEETEGIWRYGAEPGARDSASSWTERAGPATSAATSRA
jgi:hypothetical protein